MSPTEEYKALKMELAIQLRSGKVSEFEEEKLLNQIESLWLRFSRDERNQINTWNKTLEEKEI